MKCDNCRYRKMCYRRFNPIGDKYSHTDNCEHYEEYKQRPHGEWEYLKEHITEMRDADGELNQKQTCKFILELMGVIEREGGVEC